MKSNSSIPTKIFDIDQAKVRKELRELEDETGLISPQLVVEAARNTKKEIYKSFGWGVA